jgi:protein involved in polysaccharide export with SLBB domain
MPSRVILSIIGLLAIICTASPAIAAVHPGDELFVTVYYHPELTGPISVDSTNHISMPLVGAVDVRGLETKQIAAKLQESLRAYVVKPAVAVQLKTQLPVVFISGGPGGTLKYEPGETLAAALGTLAPRLLDVTKDAALGAGGAQAVSFIDLQRARVDLRHVGLVRDEKILGTFDVVELFARGTGGPELQAGDTLTMSNKPHVVRVSGDVARPGVAFLSEDEPLTDALSQVGGLSPTASTGLIQLKAGGSVQTISQGDPRWNSPANTIDSIVVPVAARVNIVGLVEKPGPIALKTDTTLLSAMYEAGGPTNWADLRNVQVIQNGARSSYDVTRLVHGDMTQNPQLHDGDLVFVPEGHKVSAVSVFQNLLSAALLFRLH